MPRIPKGEEPLGRGARSAGGRAPVAPKAQKAQPTQTAKRPQETQVRKTKLNRRYQKMCSKGLSFDSAQRNENRTYRRFNCTKERMRFLSNPQTCRKAGGGKAHSALYAGAHIGAPLHKWNKVTLFGSRGRGKPRPYTKIMHIKGAGASPRPTSVCAARSALQIMICIYYVFRFGSVFAGIYDNPKFFISASLFRQPSLTFTQMSRLTLISKKRSSSARASLPIFLSMAPFLPMTMPLCDSLSQ